MTTTPCEVCGRRSARYICQSCGRRICEACLDPWRWTCTACQDKLAEIPTPSERRSDLVFKVFLSGFAIVVLGMILMIAASMMPGAEQTSGAAIILIGPIPIGFGYGRFGLEVFALAILFAAVAFVIFLAMWRRGRY